MFFVTAAGVIAVVAYTTVAKWQLDATIAANTDMHTAATAAQESADAAVAANNTTREQLSPYLIVDTTGKSRITLSEDGSIKVNLIFHNTGQSWARNGYIDIALAIKPIPNLIPTGGYQTTVRATGVEISQTEPYPLATPFPKYRDALNASIIYAVTAKLTMDYFTTFGERKTQKAELVANMQDLNIAMCCTLIQLKDSVALVYPIDYSRTPGANTGK